ncbi:MAG TPA: HDOD domain-containing protein [Steroidobacteraceae bacterium]|nr:HDOD domain-containing protein [Steroidobacteraceae bacterium]
MGSQKTTSPRPDLASPEPETPAVPSAAEVFVARQPIYDSAMAVTAYELLYRHSLQSTAAEISDARQATLQVITNAALEIGLERLAGGLPIHVNFPEDLLVAVPDLPLRPELAVIEVLEHVPAKPAVLEGIKALRARGHRIALDDYLPQVTPPQLLEVADIAKIEISQVKADELPRLVKDLKARGLHLIAEQVETVEQFERCIEMGFDGFQGNFLQHPQTFRAKRVPSSKLGTLRLVASLQNEEYSVDEVEKLLSQNVSMSYHVLRCINSSYYNLPRKVDSIRQAIVILGAESLRQLCALICLQGFDDRPPSLYVHAMTRARMCEQLGRLAGARDGGPFFITGLFSLLGALVGMPTQKIIEELPLSAPVTRALVAGEGVLGEALQCTRAYERAAWNHVAYGTLPPHLIRAAYVDALFWAEQARSLIAK